MAIFLVIRTQNGPDWDPAKPMEAQTLWREHAECADSEAALRAELARDPWHESHLVVESVEPWTIRVRSPLLDDSGLPA